MNQMVERRTPPDDLKIVWHALSENEVLAKLEAPPRTRV
jgi:hypothetical protein